MKTKIVIAALLASAAIGQATPAISTPKTKSLPNGQVRTVFRTSGQNAGQKVAAGPFLNHPDSAPGPH